MKFTYAILVVPVVALAARDAVEPLYRRANGTDPAALLTEGIAKAMTCFGHALDKAVGRVVATAAAAPPGIDCDALVALINQGVGPKTTPNTTTAASPPSNGTASTTSI